MPASSRLCLLEKMAMHGLNADLTAVAKHIPETRFDCL
ncbi:hypothetical protein SAMN05421546_1166 [Solilutibacter tolerans]|uniref:Uncharacterized protein n=1 Tax=Solilutibacter tolerans TaxID=1604334 RepID=A0A1N6S2H8_9GAMM|nr:hypothetical protein SAMN05421546_1166 [Lysobacter tolerans]